MPYLERVTALSVIRRLEEALEGAIDPILAFDADGTLWRGDVGSDLFRGAIERRAFQPEAAELFDREARSIGLRTDGDLTDVATRLLEAFHSGLWEDGPAAVAMAICYVGVAPDTLTALADEVLAAAGIEARLHPGVVEILAWANHRNVRVHVVSASPIAAVVAGVRKMGITSEQVIAMRTALRSDGKLAMELEGESVYGEGKVRALETALPTSTILGAFGDSAGDAFMLRKARVPVAVGPTPRLLEVADTVDGLVVLPFPAQQG